MKLVMALLCGLVLLVAPALAALPSPCPGAASSVACQRSCCCCCHGHAMKCCMASSAKPAPPAPANATRSGAQNDFSLLALALLTSLAPVAEACPQISPAPSPLTATAAPLLARLCIRLI